MSILYEFSNELRTRNVQFPWVDGLDTLKAGTPLDINGAIVNDDTAVGIVAEDVPRNWGRLISRDGNFYANVQVIVAGYVDLAEAEASCGLEYTDALKGKLADIVFADGKVSFGESGGGSEPTKTYYIPEQTVTITDNMVELSNVTFPYLSEGEKVLFSINGTEYEGTKVVGKDYAIIQGQMSDNLGFSFDPDTNYFGIANLSDLTIVSGTYTVSAYTIEESGGGGGDFTTAQVSVVNNSSSPFEFHCCHFEDAGEDSMSYSSGALPPRAPVPFTMSVIMYKGIAQFECDNESLELSGDITNGGTGVYFITGDGTITVPA